MRELIITNKGKELMTKLIAGTTTITFTKIKTTDENVESDLEILEDFNVVKQEALISSIEKTDYTVVEILAMINNMDLGQGYYIKAVGLYAQDGDKTEVLYGVSVAGDHPDYMPAYGGKTVSTITYKLITKVDNSEQVNIEINSAALPTITQVNEIKNITIETKELVNKHIIKEITSEEGSHRIKYDESSQTLKYKKSDSWHNIPTGQNAESLINIHKSKSILNEDGAHDLKYDKESNKFKYKESESWHDIDTGESVREELNLHEEKKVSDVDGVHGITFIEEEDLLRITKQDGQVANYKAGVDPDLLFSDLNTGLDNCIEKVGRTNE